MADPRSGAGPVIRCVEFYNIELAPLAAEHKAFLARVVEEGPVPAIHGVVRWRACDLIMRLHEEFGLSVSDDTIYRALHKLADFAGLRLSPSNWWHYQPFAAASTLSTARAIAELQVAGKADAHLPQSLTIAVDGDAFGRQSIIRADKRIDDLTGGDA